MYYFLIYTIKDHVSFNRKSESNRSTLASYDEYGG